MIKDTMTPTEALAFRIRHEDEIKAIGGAVISAITATTAIMLLLSPILVPLWLVQKTINGVRNTWNWFFPEPQADPIIVKVRAQFKKARANRK